MNIGIVTTWFERGAAYVSRSYEKMLTKEGHNVFIFARGGESIISNDDNSIWNNSNVTRDNFYISTRISKNKYKRWIIKNKIEVVLFNEQQNYEILLFSKKHFKEVKIGAYVDYYTEVTIPWFDIYDFLICNTKRHYSAMKNHKQKYYVKWGTDIDIFKPKEKNTNSNEKIVFFHSAGMSNRKGTDVLIDAFIHGKLYEKAKLIVHAQIPIQKICHYSVSELVDHEIEIINETVTAPGLYHLGDVYVYPTKLDGLGLTMYEAISCGLPVITTNYPPMNEIINEKIGRLVDVEYNYSRSDGYFWPMSQVNEESLIKEMSWYINNVKILKNEKLKVRKYAVEYYNIDDRSSEIARIFTNSIIRDTNIKLMKDIQKYYIKHFSIISYIKEIRLVNYIRRFI